MIKKLTLLVGAGAGYVLGSKAGRERYEAIMGQVQKLMGTPQAQKVSDSLHQTAGDLADKATTAAVSASDAVKDKAIDLTGSTPPVSTPPVSAPPVTVPPVTTTAITPPTTQPPIGSPRVTTSTAPRPGAAPSGSAPDSV